VYVASTKTCTEHDRLVPYLKLQYCVFGNGETRNVLFQITATLILLTTQYTASRQFFHPALENLSCFFALPDDVCGATLLMLSNAVPWVAFGFFEIAKKCGRDGCVGGFDFDPREGGGLLKVLTNALTSIAFLVTLVLPVVVLTTPHGMGGRKHRNEDDDDDEADDGNQPVTNPNPFVPPAGTYLPVLSEEETESVDDKNETETENAGDDIRASGLAEPLLGDGDGDEETHDIQVPPRGDGPLPVSDGGDGDGGDGDGDSVRDPRRVSEFPRASASPRRRDHRVSFHRFHWRRFVVAVTEKGGVELERAPFVRDGVFALCAVAATCSVAGNGRVTKTEAAGLLGAYAVYFLVAVIPNFAFSQRNRASATGAAIRASTNRTNRILHQGLLDDGETFDDGYAALMDGVIAASASAPGILGSPKRGALGPSNGAPGMRWGGGGAGSAAVTTSRTTSTSGLPGAGGYVASRVVSRGSVPFGEKLAIFGRTCARVAPVIVQAPFLFALRLTMPDLSRDPNRRSRFAIAVLPITAPLFIISATRVFPNGRLGIDAAVYGSVCGLFASVALFVAWPVLLKPDASQSSVKLMDMTLTVLAFVVSVTWIHAASQELVALTFAAGAANAGGEVQKSVSHPTRSASAIGPITGDCLARLRVTVRFDYG